MNSYLKHIQANQDLRIALAETGNLKHTYHNELDKAGLQHDMAYGDFKYSPRNTASDKVLKDKVFNILKNPKFDGYQHGRALILVCVGDGGG